MKQLAEEVSELITTRKWWIAEAPASLQSVYPFMVGYARLHRYFPEYYSVAIAYLSRGYVWQYLDEQESLATEKMLFDSYLDESRLMQQRYEEWKEKYRHLQTVIRRQATLDLGALSNEKLATLYDDFYDSYIDSWTISLILESAGFYSDKVFLAGLRAKYNLPDKKATELFGQLSQPAEASFLALERLDWLRLVLAPKAEQVALLASYQKKYYWIKTTFQKAPAWDTQAVRLKIAEEFEHRSREEIAIELQKLSDHIAHLETAQTKASRSSGFAKEELRYFEVIRLLSLWRDERKEMVNFGNHHLFWLLDEIAIRLKITQLQATYALPAELSAALRGKISLDTALLDSRHDASVLIVNDKEEEELVAGQPARNIKVGLDGLQEEVATIAGMTACLGEETRIEGIVTVVFDPTKTDFLKGNVLVTPMTRPDFVPLMRKAIAIITDQGGITSHAAIVSRELNLPCIVGTKIATRQLKDGDRVVVDTVSGTVQKVA